jgi:hypothetical protein
MYLFCTGIPAALTLLRTTGPLSQDRRPRVTIETSVRSPGINGGIVGACGWTTSGSTGIVGAMDAAKAVDDAMSMEGAIEAALGGMDVAAKDAVD